MQKLLFRVALLASAFCFACSSQNTYPPLIADCDGACGSPIISESGPDSGTNDSSLDADATGDSSDALDDSQSTVDTGASE